MNNTLQETIEGQALLLNEGQSARENDVVYWKSRVQELEENLKEKLSVIRQMNEPFQFPLKSHPLPLNWLEEQSGKINSSFDILLEKSLPRSAKAKSFNNDESFNTIVDNLFDEFGGKNESFDNMVDDIFANCTSAAEEEASIMKRQIEELIERKNELEVLLAKLNCDHQNALCELRECKRKIDECEEKLKDKDHDLNCMSGIKAEIEQVRSDFVCEKMELLESLTKHKEVSAQYLEKLKESEAALEGAKETNKVMNCDLQSAREMCQENEESMRLIELELKKEMERGIRLEEENCCLSEEILSRDKVIKELKKMWKVWLKINEIGSLRKPAAWSAKSNINYTSRG